MNRVEELGVRMSGRARMWVAAIVTGSMLGWTAASMASAPPGPGCTVTTTNVTNATPVVIAAGDVPVVTTAVSVAGAGSYLWDLDVTTFLTHSNCSDLDITLMSPSGTVVTLTTDNGNGNDNCFNGTVWDDDANPGGPVPYDDNDGMVTDTSFVDGTPATPLTPEEPLGAFIGEDPNGIWTLTISDDEQSNGGALTSWSLDVSSLPSAPTETIATFENAADVAITDDTTVISQVHALGVSNRVCKVRVLTHITHTFAADLVIGLTSPSGTIVTLSSESGGGLTDIFNGTQWDDAANPGGQVPYDTNDGLVTDHLHVTTVTSTPLAPEEPFAAFIGEDPNGLWALTIGDTAGGDEGVLADWTLEITTCSYPDADGDGVGDPCDECATGNDTLDGDGDGIPDACDSCGICGVGVTAMTPLMVVGFGMIRRSNRRRR
jgi:subtilisin-like proprotein convertase family protein